MKTRDKIKLGIGFLLFGAGLKNLFDLPKAFPNGQIVFNSAFTGFSIFLSLLLIAAGIWVARKR
jgi:predicted transporter